MAGATALNRSVYGSGQTEAEKFLASQADSLARDAARYRSGQDPKWSAGMDARYSAIAGRRNAAMIQASIQQAPMAVGAVFGAALPQAIVPSAFRTTAQIQEGFMPPFFTKDRSKFPGSVVGGEYNQFQNSLREIEQAKAFLFKKEPGIGGLGGGLAVGGTQWAFEQMADAEFLEAFDKLEKSVQGNTKQQNAGTAALKGSQEAIAIIARSEGMQTQENRVFNVMDAIKQKMETENTNSNEIKKDLKEWLNRNPGVISREP
jgi:hypothetical protein